MRAVQKKLPAPQIIIDLRGGVDSIIILSDNYMPQLKMPKHDYYEPIKTKRTFEEVSDRVKELIFEGVLKPGEKLPSEHELAKKFQVGRQSVREALRLLELSGFISVQRGINGGPLIENTMLNKMAGMFLDSFKFHRVPIDDLSEARAKIEKIILDSAIDHADETDTRALRANIEQARHKLENNQLAFEENTEYHRLLAKASKNHVFVMVMESILAVESDFRSRFKNIDVKMSSRITLLHEEILNALVQGDHTQAQQLLDRLFEEVHGQFKGSKA